MSRSAALGGCAVMVLAVVGPDVRIGKGAIVNANATVADDAAMGELARLGVIGLVACELLRRLPSGS